MEESVKIAENLPRGRVCVLESENAMRLYSGSVIAEAGKRLYLAARDIKEGETVILRHFENTTDFIISGTVEGDEVTPLPPMRHLEAL